MTAVRIPILDLRAQYATIREELDAAVARVVHAQHFVLGPEVDAFEKEIAAYLGAPFAVGVASGTDALALALTALGVGHGHAVVTTPMTFIATGESIARVGARPLFVDIRDDDLNLDPAKVEDAIARSPLPVRALVPVHLFGRVCDVEALSALAKKHGAHLVEDAAQALGARKGGQAAGTFGDAASFSFFPSKNLGAFGDGGLVTTGDAAVAEHVKRLRQHGMRARYEHHEPGLNSRLDALQAAVLRAKLPHLDAWNSARRAKVAAYRRAFAGSPVRVMLEDGDGRHDIFHLCVVRVPAAARDGLQRHLAARGIQTIVHYPKALHEQPVFAPLGYAPDDFPVTRRACAEVISLPLYPELPDAALEEIAHEIRAYLGAGA